MKPILIFLIFGLLSLNSSAQNHACADVKIANHLALAKTEINSEQATRLMAKYDMQYYDIQLLTEMSSTGFEGDVRFSAEALENIDTLCFQLANIVTLDSVFLDGSLVTHSRNNDDVLIPLATSLSAGQNFELRVKYNSTYSGGGFFSEGIKKQKYMWTPDTVISSMSSPYYMRYWLPAKEVLTDKIDSVDITVLTEIDLQVGSNGLLVKHDTVGPHSRFHWKTNYPIDYYLISIAVADYQVVESYAKPASASGDSILMQNFTFNDSSLNSYIYPILDTTDRMMEYYSDHFGLYPFHTEKYGNCMAPLYGGMEHQTMTTIGIPDVGIFSHELAHMWFGDYVTCASYADVSINEGFATYCQILTQEFLYGAESTIEMRKDIHSEVKTVASGSVYCDDTTDVSRIFDGRLSYNKGAAAIATLRYTLGDSLFFNGVKYFLQQHAFGTATFQDLKADLEAFTNVNLDDYFAQWIYGEGYPLIYIFYYQDGGDLKFALKQVNAYPNSVSFFKGPIDIEATNGAGVKTRIRVDWDYDEQSFSMPFTGTLSSIIPDPDYHIIHKFMYAKEDVTVSVGEHNLSHDWSVYPVPFGNTVYIQSDAEVYHLTVIDAQGRVIDEQEINSKNTSLNTEGWSTGVYSLSLEFEDGRRESKLLEKL